jgi:hypothetical protein
MKMAQGKTEGLKSIDRFCEAHELSRSSVYRLIRERKLRAVKVNGCTRITPQDEARFLANLPDMVAAA